MLPMAQIKRETMIYIMYMLLILLFWYNTPLYGLIVDFIRKKPIFLTIIAIFGDALYMIGGGIIAGAMINLKGSISLKLVSNYGTILIVIGAMIREFFNKLKG